MFLDLSRLSQNEAALSALVLSGIRKGLKETWKSMLSDEIIGIRMNAPSLTVLVRSSLAASELRMQSSKLIDWTNATLAQSNIPSVFAKCVFRIWNPGS